MPDTVPAFQLIVVGSSAGGIEALSQLVATLPVPLEVPLVIAQHLAPQRASHLAEILIRHTTLPVVTVENQELLKPGTIYVVPSNHHVAITDHDVTLLPDGDGRPTPSINLLLSSAAETYNDKLIAIILTGTGRDGSEGARIVHARGGIVIIQNPQTAAYPGMPQSLDPEIVDYVTDLPDIGSLLADLINDKQIIEGPLNPLTDLEPLLVQVREHTRIDFSTYKPATILRRVQRRFLATGVSDVASYIEYLGANPDEYEILVADFLIKVTEFMRDPELFTYLQEQILPNLIEYSRSHDNELRFWSAGCATGEEAYSLAILLAALLGKELGQFNIKIFATDLDSAAITFARRGVYPSKSLDKLSSELVERYFVLNSSGTTYEVKKQIRNMLVFGEHDLGQRAPFPRIDLLLCRNVLIYFNRKLQEHALQLFTFALRDEGYLVLGRTETVSPVAEFFDVREANQRVYQRQGVRRLTPPTSLRNVTFPSLPKPVSEQKPKSPRLERALSQMQQEAYQNRLTRDNLLLKLPVGVVVVDSRFDIVEINAAARRMLSIHTVAIGEDFVHLAQNIPPREIGQAITRTISENKIYIMEPVEVPHLITGETTFLQISCYPQPMPNQEEQTDGLIDKGDGQHALVIVNDLTHEITAQRKLKQDNLKQTSLVQELNQRILNLQETNAELQKNNTQLQQTNETQIVLKETELNQLKLKLQQDSSELVQLKNEQSEAMGVHTRQMEGLVETNRHILVANEELTTQNANLRTENEEFMLHTEEAQAAIEEVDTLNEEMQATNEELETLNEELQATVEELNTTNSDLVVQGDTLVKLTEELRIQQKLIEREKAQLAAIVANMADALVVVDRNNKILLTNTAYEQLLRNTEGLVLLDEESAEPLSAEEMPLARAARGETFNLIYSFRDSKGDRHWLEAIGQPVHGNEMADWSVMVLRDITERSLRRVQEQFLSLISHELRTPITVIKGYSQRIESFLRKKEGDFEKPLENLAQVLAQVEHLRRLINDLVDVNRLQSGKFTINFEPVSLNSLFSQLTETGQMLTPKLVIESVSEDEPLWVKGDAVRLQQVIINLINNAIIHAPTSPKINLKLSRVVGSDLAEITVQDYGPGIKAEHLKDLFSKFYQVLQNKPAPSSGLGLGLYICQQIVEAHGGTIRVESREGEGATFIVQLPLIKMKASK